MLRTATTFLSEGSSGRLASGVENRVLERGVRVRERGLPNLKRRRLAHADRTRAALDYYTGNSPSPLAPH